MRDFKRWYLQIEFVPRFKSSLTVVKYVSSTNTAALSLRGREGGEGKDRFEYPESGKEKSSTRSEPTSASAGEGKRVATRAKVQTSSVKRKRKLSESVNDERSQSQQRDHGKRVKGGNSHAHGTDEAKNLFKFQPHPFTRSVAQSQSTLRKPKRRMQLP